MYLPLVDIYKLFNYHTNWDLFTDLICYLIGKTFVGEAAESIVPFVPLTFIS